MSEGVDSRLRISQTFLAVLVIAMFGMIAYKYLPSKGEGKDFTTVPKEFQLNYLPADFNFDIDEQDALAILTNPKRYRREFGQMVYDMNMAILNHTANRMGLSESIKRRLPEEYDKHHEYLRNLYYDDFLSIKDTTSALYQTWYDNGFKNAAQIWYEVAAKYTCYLVNNVMGGLIPMKDGAFYAKGKKVDTPCGIALTEALAPLMKKIEERAAIEDFGRSHSLLQQRVEKVVSELATYEIRDKKGLTKQFQTKVWGFSVSSTDVEITAISILKIGFKLDDYFNIQLNSKSKLVTITLPEPIILSHEVYPKMDRLSIGWLREIKSDDLNKAFNVLREEFRRDALNADAMDKAKVQAREVLNTMMGPLIGSLGSKYKMRVMFEEGDPTPKEFLPKDRFNQDLPQQ